MHDPMFIIKPRLKKPDPEITEAKGDVLPSHSLTVTLLAGECDHSPSRLRETATSAPDCFGSIFVIDLSPH